MGVGYFKQNGPSPSDNYAEVADAAFLDTAGSIDVRSEFVPEEITGVTYYFARFGTDNLWRFGKSGSAFIGRLYDSSSTQEDISRGSYTPVVGQREQVRLVLNFISGEAEFYYRQGATAEANALDSDDNWTALLVRTLTSADLKQGDSRLVIGNYDPTSSGMPAQLRRFIYYHGTDSTGTKQIDADFTSLTQAEIAAGEFTEDSANAATVTLNGTGWTAAPGVGSVLDRAVLKLQAKNYSGSGDWLDESGFGHDATVSGAKFLSHDGEQYLWLPGASGNYASAPDSAAVSVTGDIDLRVKLERPADGTASRFFSKYIPTGNQRSWSFYINAAGGVLYFDWTEDGSTLKQENSGAGTLASAGYAAGDDVWVRVTLDVDDGASDYALKFYTSPDGVVWTQLGATDTGGATTSIFDGTAGIEIGTVSGGGAVGPHLGRIYRAQIYDGIGGTLAFDADFTDTAALTEPFATFTEKSSNAATVTINRAASGYVSTVVDRDLFLFDGTDDYLSVADHADLDFGASDDLSVLALVRVHDETRGEGFVVKSTSSFTSSAAGYSLNNSSTDSYIQFRTNDGALITSLSPTGLAVRTLAQVAGVRDTSVADVTALLGGSAGTPEADASPGSLSNGEALVIGRNATTGSTYTWGQIIAVVLWREALSDADVAAAGEALLGAGVPSLMLLGVG
jgi:hypothetical protein